MRQPAVGNKQTADLVAFGARMVAQRGRRFCCVHAPWTPLLFMACYGLVNAILACFLVSQCSIAAVFFCAERRFPGGFCPAKRLPSRCAAKNEHGQLAERRRAWATQVRAIRALDYQVRALAPASARRRRIARSGRPAPAPRGNTAIRTAPPCQTALHWGGCRRERRGRATIRISRSGPERGTPCLQRRCVGQVAEEQDAGQPALEHCQRQRVGQWKRLEPL